MRYLAFGFFGFMIAGAVGLAVLAWRTEISVASISPSARGAQDLVQIEAGARLALLGNCAGCHTIAGGAALTGGLAIHTPFGVIYSTNITPDPATGIGDWSLAAYMRAMREGVDREGRHLYPAFPYEYFTHISDADLADLYAWNMAQPPVAARTPPNDLTFPANLRPLLAGWKLLYHTNARFAASPAQSQVWNDGAYLAEGLGHCSACHTPRNRLGGAIASQVYQGGEAHDWWAPPLTSSNPAPQVWAEADLLSYLRTGRSYSHGVAAGPMASVVHDSLALVPETDITALAHYFGDWMARPPSPEDTKVSRHGIARVALANDSPPMGSEVLDNGARLFSANCATCHHDSGPSGTEAFPQLSDGSTVAGPDARNLVQVMLWGIGLDAGSAHGYMPRFADELTNEQIAAIAAFLRGDSVAVDSVARLRAGGPVAKAGAGPLSGFASTMPGNSPPDMGTTP